jgi:dipeptidyl aminopeptidase/acylaminoacyl peptidase
MPDTTDHADADPTDAPTGAGTDEAASDGTADSAPVTPFHDLDAYVALPRMSGLAMSADGTRLVTTVAELSGDRTRYISSLWQIDPEGDRPARRLTRSASGESVPTFAPDGCLLFLSDRSDRDDDATTDPPSALMSLPWGGGEATLVARRPGGITGFAVAAAEGTVVALSPTLPSSGDAEDDGQRQEARKALEIDAVLHDAYPLRYWDHDLGPAATRLLAGPVSHATSTTGPAPADPLTDLTPSPGRALDEADLAVAPDGSFAVVTWYVPHEGGRRQTLQRIDTSTGERVALVDDPDREAGSPAVSPDSTQVAAVVQTRSTADEPPRHGLVVIDVASGTVTDVDADLEAPTSTPVWTPDGKALLVCADERGRRPVFRIDAVAGTTTRLTGDDGAYDDLVVGPGGRYAYAIRTAIDSPPAVVRIDAGKADGVPTALPDPVGDVVVPGRLDELMAEAEDGTLIRAWLALPDGASADDPAPLLLWIHGGPVASTNAWSWRWNPWLAVARGYAVLMPDPALSTGYGHDFVKRGWGAWGAAPYTDLMAITDAALERDDLDGDRTAAMGGSFGGYMANWIAGHTDRFDAIVTHASLWALDQFVPTTDVSTYWRRELTADVIRDHSPHHHVDAITTPMLVIHGDRDYRVPIGEGLRLWSELAARQQLVEGEMPHRFLLFPGEHHWILRPQHARLWYETVFAFLAWHVLGGEWEPPALLG